MKNELAFLLDPEYWKQVKFRGGEMLGNLGQVSQGVAAGAVGAPVDIANMALTPFGLGSKNPVGGSNQIAKLFGAQTESTPYQVGTMLPVSPEGMAMGGAKLAGLVGMAASKGSKLQDMVKMAKPNENVAASAVADLPYQIEHKPMTTEGGASRLHDLTSSFGEDIYGRHALEYFGSGDDREKAIINMLRSVRGNPDAKVTIYRGLPSSAKGINSGDWVTLHPGVAKDYADLLKEQGIKGKVVKMEVPASSITSWPDSLLEFGYYPL